MKKLLYVQETGATLYILHFGKYRYNSNEESRLKGRQLLCLLRYGHIILYEIEFFLDFIDFIKFT